MQREAASPRQCAAIFSIPHHHVRSAIKAGELVPRAVGRKSILIFDDVKAWIRTHPPTKTSRPKQPQE